MEKTFCEFFAGVGLVHTALASSGWRRQYANDIDPKKKSMHDGHFGASELYHEGDVWDTAAVIDRIEGRPALATASFPCTDMSLAGKRQGLAGEQSGALFGFLGVLEELADRRPPMVLLENVPGFLNSRGGADFAAAIHELAALGYWVDSFILDASWFVPQSRERMFVVGYAEELVESSPVLIRRTGGEGLQDAWQAAVDGAKRIRPARLVAAMNAIEPATGWATLDSGSPTPGRRPLGEFLDLSDDQLWWSQQEVDRHAAMMFDRHRRMVDSLVADARAVTPLTGFRRVRQGQQRLEVRFDGVAGCLRTPRGGSAKQVVLAAGRNELRMRWMTPREYARLQGAPDFVLPANDIQAWFGFGDAVCVPVIEWIDRKMLTPVWEEFRVQGSGGGRAHSAAASRLTRATL